MSVRMDGGGRNAREVPAGAPAQKEKSDSLEEQLKARTYNVLLSRLATMLMLTLFVGAATLLTFFFTRAASLEEIDILGGSLRRDLLGRTADQLRTLLDVQARCSRQLSDGVWRAWDFNETLAGPAPPDAIDKTIDYLQYADAISGTGFCTPEGIFSSAYNGLALPGLPPPSDAILALLSTNETTPAGVTPPTYVRVVDRITRRTVVGPLQTPYLKVDCRTSDYYKLGESSPTEKVIGVLPGVGEPEPNLTQLNQIGFVAGRTSRGIAGCIVSLKNVGDYLAQLELEGGIIFVTSGTVLLASSVGYTGQNSSGNGNSVLLPAQSSNPVIRATDSFLRAQGGAIAVEMDTDVTLLGVRSFVTKRDVSFEGFNMTVVLVLPRKTIMSRIDAKARVTIVTIAVSASGIGVVGCFLVVLLTKPVSEEIRLKRELILQLEAKKRAEEQNEIKSRFLANMSHELRSPLASILGLLDLLLDDGLTPPQHNSALQMRECAAGLLGLLNDILDFSKIEAGKVSLEAMEFDAVSLMENLVDMMSVHSARKGIELVLDVAEDIGPVLYGDPSRFRQIFTNLLNNAIKFTKEGFVILRCREADEKGWLVFDVEDSGCGIPPERIASVFEAFVQADPSTTRIYGGTGLGLTIVKSLVHLMGGTVSIEPKERSGTIFRVRLRMQNPALLPLRSSAVPADRPRGIPPIINHLVNPVLGKGKVPPGLSLLASRGDEAQRSSGGLPPPTRAEPPPWLQRLKTLRIANSESAASARAQPPSPTDGTRRGTFPRAAGKSSESNLVRAAAVLSETPEPRARGRVLLAMGGEVGRAVAARFLEDRGLEVACAADWSAALDRLSRAGAREVGNLEATEQLVASPGFVDSGTETGGENDTVILEERTPAYDLVLLDVGLLKIDATDPDAFGQRLKAVREILVGASKPKAVTILQMEQGAEEGSAGTRWTRSGATGSGTTGNETTGSGTNRSRRTGPFAGSQVVWLVGNEVRAAARRVLHEVGFGRVLQKPVFASRLRGLLTELSAARQEDSEGISRGESSAGLTLSNETAARIPLLDIPECTAAAESQPATPTTPVNTSPGAKEALEQFQRAGYRALIAEDNPVLRQLAQKVLVKMGAHVVTVENGQQAVETVLAANLGGTPAETGGSLDGTPAEFGGTLSGTEGKCAHEAEKGRAQEPFDFVLMDCQMPVMDGYAATRAIRAAENDARAHERARTRPRLPILALTAHAMAEDEARCLEAGMDLYLTKPLQMAKLADVIVDHMGRRG